MNQTIFCCNENIKPLFENIDDNVYKPIEMFEKKFKIKILNENYIKNDKLVQSIDNDNIIHYFIKSSKDISLIFVYPKCLKYPLDKLYDELNKNGKIYYEKDITLSYNAMYNLIFQLYFNEQRMKNPDNINYKVERIGFNYDESNKIKIIVYKHNNIDEPISGNSSPFKMKLRQIFYDLDNENNIPDLKLYDYIHINNDDNQAYVYAGIIFNNNSLKFLEKQNSWKIYDMIKSINLFNKVKRFINQFGQIGYELFITFSSSILFSYGVREMNDIDGYIVSNDMIDIDIFNKFNNKDIDITLKGSTATNEKWLETLDERAVGYGATNFNELVLNPNYHYYFMGVKFLRLKYDIITRIKRGRPAQITDLLVLRQMYDYKYQLSIPKVTKTYDEEKMTDIEKQVNEMKFLETIKFYLEKRYYINLTIEQINDWIYNYKFIDNSCYSPQVNQLGGDSEYFIENKDISTDKIIYPTELEIIKMGYVPRTIIYSDDKPYLYPGEVFKKNSVEKYCNKENDNFKKPSKYNLSIMSFNVHNFISRCNAGLNPSNNKINPYMTPRDISKFISFFDKYSPDIICLQEMVPILDKPINKDIKDYSFIRNNFNFEYLNYLMETIGYKYKVIANTRKGNLLENENNNYYLLANGIYSRYKINKYKINQFSFIDRNFIHIEITKNNKNIDIINLHFEYFISKSINNPDINDVTLLQHQLFHQYLEKIKNENILVCGDFNINLKNKQVGKRYISFEEKTKYYNDNYNYVNYPKISTNFSQDTTTDFILLSKKSKLKVIYNNVIYSNLSDHYPIIGYLK